MPKPPNILELARQAARHAMTTKKDEITVEDLKDEVLRRMGEPWLAESDEQAVDALIAAVRAESAPVEKCYAHASGVCAALKRAEAAEAELAQLLAQCSPLEKS
jgi:hypothetical protein